MKEGGRANLGFVLMVVGLIVLLLPVFPASRQEFNIGLGVSHRDEDVSVGVGASSFEVARVYNTEDEAYTLDTGWHTRSSSCEKPPEFNVVPSSREVEPGESFLVTCEVSSTGEGTVEGVAVLQVTPNSRYEPQPSSDDDLSIGGTVVPGAELPFTVTVTQNPQPYTIPYLPLLGAAIMIYGMYLFKKTQ